MIIILLLFVPRAVMRERVRGARRETRERERESTRGRYWAWPCVTRGGDGGAFFVLTFVSQMSSSVFSEDERTTCIKIAPCYRTHISHRSLLHTHTHTIALYFIRPGVRRSAARTHTAARAPKTKATPVLFLFLFTASYIMEQPPLSSFGSVARSRICSSSLRSRMMCEKLGRFSGM